MSDQFTNRVISIVDAYLRNRAESRNGIVTSYDPNTYCVKVQIMPDAADTSDGQMTESGWIALHSQMVGNGWGLVIGPAIGAQVSLRFQESDYGSPSIDGQFFDETNPIPSGGGPQSGEFWPVDQNGQYIKLLASGGVKIVLNSGTEIDIGNTQNTLQPVCLQPFFQWASTHTHGGVQTGSGTTGEPSSVPPSDGLTTILKAN
jgi:hypothetical protein